MDFLLSARLCTPKCDVSGLYIMKECTHHCGAVGWEPSVVDKRSQQNSCAFDFLPHQIPFLVRTDIVHVFNNFN